MDAVQPAGQQAGSSWSTLARESSRESFVRACPFPFLVGGGELDPPLRARGTIRVEVGARISWSLGSGNAIDERTLLLPVRKTQDSFPSMITVGRTPNNDLVVPDISISRLHAYFHRVGDCIELFDAGSRNGTTVGGTKLSARGAPRAVTSGDELCFGRICFTLLGAGALWDRLRREPDW